MAISSENGKTAEAQLPTKHNSDSEMRDEDHAAEEQQKSQQSMASDAQKETSNVIPPHPNHKPDHFERFHQLADHVHGITGPHTVIVANWQ